MKLITVFRIVLFQAAVLAVLAPAQTNTRQVPAASQAIGDAIAFRDEMAKKVDAGTETPAEAINRLALRTNAMGFDFEEKQDFSLAATDIGQRLVSKGKPAAAEPFFVAAEQALGEGIQRTANARAADKSRLYEHRAFLRTQFLNKSDEAESDLTEAVKLRPDDEGLRRKRDEQSAKKLRLTRPGKKG